MQNKQRSPRFPQIDADKPNHRDQTETILPVDLASRIEMDMGAARLPDFIGNAFALFRPTYDHLIRDEWAVTILNLTVAAGESERWKQEWDDVDLRTWHDEILQNLNERGDLRILAPPTWRAAVSYACLLTETLGEVIAARAESADELIQIPWLLQNLSATLGLHLFEYHLENFFDDHRIRPAFFRFFETKLEVFQKDEAVRAWDMYHGRLKEALQSGPPHSREGEMKACERSSVVSPLLAEKSWSINRWGNEAGVGKNCPYEYLAGRRDLTEPNRRAMAEALGLAPEQLPNE